MQIKELKPCCNCKKSLFAAVSPIGYRIKLTTLGLDASAARQQLRLEMMLGNLELASVFAPDPEIIKPVGPEETLFVCLRCLLEMHVAQLIDAAGVEC